ncbi:MAG: ThuA domain-containing protein [Proteobacteria bacterium]|nr:ThuA domain-containing protein [Pseudomonadota bacterium]
MNTQHNQKRGQGFNAIHLNFFEFPTEDPERLEVYCYTDQISYAPGQTVIFHTSTTGTQYDIEVIRDGVEPQLVHEIRGLAGFLHKTPVDAPVKGCAWPEACRWVIPDDVLSGGYLVRTVARSDRGDEVVHYHFFAVRAARPGAGLLLVCATGTWVAYNDWGGASHYEGNVEGADINRMSPVLSLQRPWATGQVWLPVGVPRIPRVEAPEIGAIPRYPNLEFAYAMGYSKYYASAGWASYERHFLLWAERNGIAADVATQLDLQFRPEMLAGYDCVVFVGHDEYWSAEQRDAVDAYVDQGGNVARFGGNFIWQVRIEDEGRTQVCYKYFAEELDEVGKQQPEKMTCAWDYAPLRRPGAATFGLTGTSACYTGLGGFCPRGAKGFTVYRPEHWIFDETDLYYGDTFGSEARIFAYEVDGVEFTFRDGLPYPTFTDGAPDTLEILAMAPATNAEEDHGNPGTRLYAGEADWHFLCHMRYGEVNEENLARSRGGAGMIGVFTRNGGTVVNAGSVEWVNGLRLRDPVTEQVTLNVIRRFTQREAK